MRVGAPTLVETSLVFASRKGGAPGRAVEELVAELRRDDRPVRRARVAAAADAFTRDGRGRYKASLNLGDCLAYATAATAGDTLLFVGGDFRHADLKDT